MNQTLEDFKQLCEANGVHTVEVAVPDTQGHLRGKRVPADRFFATTHESGCNIADAMFVFDIQNDLPDNEFINMDTGYADCHLTPDVSTGRILTHRPGYAIVFASTSDIHGNPHPHAPREVLAAQIERCQELDLDPVVATEMEFFVCTPEWEPVQQHIQYSSLTDALDLEEVLAAMRAALIGAGIEVEGSNTEYGPGQVEINTGPTDAMTCADNTVLYKSIVKQVAAQHGMRATFMPKPWADQGGSGMHVHTSLLRGNKNAFADSDGAPNELMSHWLGGLLNHALSISLLGAPTVNGPRRIRPYTFAPTHIHWGLDNRTVLARCIAEAGSSANRVEFRAAGADANPYLIIAGLLAAGSDGVQNQASLPEMSTGDRYTDPGDCVPLPTDLPGAIAAFEASPLAERLGEVFSKSYVSIASAEVAHGSENNPDPDDVNDWERARYIEHS